jgi:hypothetical protein
MTDRSLLGLEVLWEALNNFHATKLSSNATQASVNIVNG